MLLVNHNNILQQYVMLLDVFVWLLAVAMGVLAPMGKGIRVHMYNTPSWENVCFSHLNSSSMAHFRELLE